MSNNGFIITHYVPTQTGDVKGTYRLAVHKPSGQRDHREEERAAFCSRGHRQAQDPEASEVHLQGNQTQGQG